MSARVLVLGRLGAHLVAHAEVLLEGAGQEPRDEEDEEVGGEVDQIGGGEVPAEPDPGGLLRGGGPRERPVRPHVVDPVDDDEDAAHRVEQRHQRPDRRREGAQRPHHVLRQDLARQQEQVRRRRPHRRVVAAREPAQHVRQRQEQTHRRAQHHVHLEQPAGAPKFIYIYI